MALLGHASRRTGTVPLTWAVGAARPCAETVSSQVADANRNQEVDAVRQRNLDLRVHDRVALDEIELYAEMLSAVAAAERPLTLAEIDMVLGVRSGCEPGLRELSSRE